MAENRGISITGGQVTAGAMAAGERSVAVNTAGSGPATVEDLRAALRELARAVEGSVPELEDPQQSVAVARMAEQEGAKDAPDKSRLTGFLQVLASGAGAVSGVAAAVTAVETVLSSIM
jgi:hypothetical protein